MIENDWMKNEPKEIYGKNVNFRSHERLAEMLDDFIGERLKKGRVLEALIFRLLVKESPNEEELSRLMREVEVWKTTPPASKPEVPVDPKLAAKGVQVMGDTTPRHKAAS